MLRSERAITSNDPAKRWVTIFALLVFFVQGLAVQTHVHQPIQSAAVKATSLPAPGPLKSPDPFDQCRLCQELVHAGAFVTPTATALLVGLSFVTAIFVALPAFAGAAARPFAWHSRAPPRR